MAINRHITASTHLGGNFTAGKLPTITLIFSLSPFAPENLASRDGFGSPVPRQPDQLHILRLNIVFAYYGIALEFRGGVHFFISTAIRHWASPEFIGSRKCVTMAFTAESPPAEGQ